MPKPLTDLERRVLDYLVEYLRTNTYQPSIREIGREFTIKSTKTVSELLQSLADKGWIERDPSRSRGVRLLTVAPAQDTVGVPLYDSADAPAPAAHFVLDRKLVGSSGAWFVAMQGDHLAEEGIRSGDLLLVESVDPPALETGDIVFISQAGATGARRCVRHGSDLVMDAVRPGEVPVRVPVRQAGDIVRGRVTTVVRRLRPETARESAVAVPIAT
ncbi:MAG TPA: hypothetical protein VK928_08345 [Longimicrobiales bacterium]|nr:hypothetical protein [Longimicrobiales bacterium]